MKNFIIILIITFVTECFSQDSLFVWPSGKEIEIAVNANAVKINSRFLYNFLVNSDLNSIQNVDDFFVEFGFEIDSILSPNYWLARISSVWTNVLMWSARDTLYDILPGNSLSGFSYNSDGLPTILKFYGVGYYELPYAEEGEAPDASEIVGGGILENSVQGYTIGASLLPNPFIPLNFLDTLLNYNQRSLELGWITNQATENKYDSLFNTAKTLLEGNHIPWVEFTLQSVLEKVDEDSSGNITSEAYALLKYNTEYLLENLPEVIPPVLTSISPGLTFTPSELDLSNGYPEFSVNVAGEFFTDSSIVYFNNGPSATTKISDTTLTFQLDSDDISEAGNYPVWISNYGSVSDTLFFIVGDTLPQPVAPVCNCIENERIAFFGYINDNNVSVYIPVSAKNYFNSESPGPSVEYIDRGQPTIFLPGTYTRVFDLEINDPLDDDTWILDGGSAEPNSRNVPPCE